MTEVIGFGYATTRTLFRGVDVKASRPDFDAASNQGGTALEDVQRVAPAAAKRVTDFLASLSSDETPPGLADAEAVASKPRPEDMIAEIMQSFSERIEERKQRLEEEEELKRAGFPELTSKPAGARTGLGRDAEIIASGDAGQDDDRRFLGKQKAVSATLR